MISIHRTTLHAGEATLIWSRAGLPGADNWGTQTLLEWQDSKGVLTKPVTYPYSPQESGYDTWKKIMIVAPSVPGVYNLVVPSAPTVIYGTVTVLPQPANPVFVSVSPGDEPSIQGIINSGKSINFNPGIYNFSSPIKLITGTHLVGINANCVTLVKQYNSLDYNNHLIEPVDYCQVYNITFQMPHPGDVFFNQNYPPTFISGINCLVSRCIFDGPINFGNWKYAGLIIDQCTFKRATAQQLAGHTWVRNCDFIGGSYAYSSWGGDQMAMTDCTFTRTDRGIVYEGNGTQGLTNSLYYRIFFQSINWVANGDELVLFEGGTATNNLFMHIRTIDCFGPGVIIYGGAASNNLFYDFDLTKSNNIWFYQGSGTNLEQAAVGISQNGNVFDTFNFWGGTINFGGAKANTLQNFGVIHPTNFYQSEIYYDPKFYAPGIVFSEWNSTLGNIIQHGTVEGLGNFSIGNVPLPASVVVK